MYTQDQRTACYMGAIIGTCLGEYVISTFFPESFYNTGMLVGTGLMFGLIAAILVIETKNGVFPKQFLDNLKSFRKA